GYFGAAQGVLLMAVLGIGVADTMQRHNATKNVLALIVNGIAALVFILLAYVDVPFLPGGAVGTVDWPVAGLIALGSVIGGQLGAGVGRRLPPMALRVLIVVVGVAAVISFLLR
ncbi:MAG: sulfite exporter TauE/SafE family protein, partial [Marmoricola sp.]|nr:sulfite exporter TauE/SafE family protein [Marmoricola sp.]